MGLYSAMHKTKVSRAVRALEQRRWLRRETNMANRREEFLWLTARGKQAFREIAPALEMFENALMERTGHSRADILATLDAIERAIG
ncbi:winged helix DNA-binding protein [Rhizorhabdus histidinilytica]|uniref:winged helix DNA-binding protein n=1 Tax=Rhizorhabdus histidinilytica TaxID=439228 RepID=UPI0022872448|nr:winged helix DNA-binding protein [Rhizorhabdus histidinilytica]